MGKHTQSNKGRWLSDHGKEFPSSDSHEEARQFAYIEEQILMSQLPATPKVGFQGYIVETTEPFTGFHHIVIACCLLAFLLMYPFIVCSRHVRDVRKRRESLLYHGKPSTSKAPQEGEFVSPPASEVPAERPPANRPSKATNNSYNNNNSSGGKGLVRGEVIVLEKIESKCNEESVCSARPPHHGEEPNKQAMPVTPTTTKSSFQDDTDKVLREQPFAPVPPAVGSTTSRRLHSLLAAQQPSHRSSQPRQASQVASSSGILSRNHSAATTGRLHTAGIGGSKAAAWPKHKHSRRPSGDPSWQWRRAIQTERRHRSRQLDQLSQRIKSSSEVNTIKDKNHSNNDMILHLKKRAAGMMSDLANEVLNAEATEQQTYLQATLQQQQPRSNKVSPHQQEIVTSSEAEITLHARKALAMRQRHAVTKQSSSQHMRRPSNSGSVRSGSVLSWSDGRYGYPPSIMSSIVDDISPNDAADADDPGKVRGFPGTSQNSTHAHRTPFAAACCMAMEPWLDVGELNEEWRRMMGLAFPVTAGALVEPVTRCVLVGILSQLVGTHAMLAYLLVHLLYRMTGETLSIAITDAESTLVQMALTGAAICTSSNQSESGIHDSPSFSKEGYRLAGEYVQLSCIVQVVFVGAVLLVWYFWIEDVLLWWVNSNEIAMLAKSYFQVIFILLLVQAIYRAAMVPCQIRGSVHSTVETVIDTFVNALTLITVGVVLSRTTDIPSEHHLEYDDGDKRAHELYTAEDRLNESRTAIITVAWIQVTVGIAACVLKFAFCVLKGWLNHFWGGLLRSIAVLNFGVVCNLLLASFPLILGSLLELGEVDLLTLFLQQLGPAEVATWALMGCIWDILEASTEGIGEAAAIRVAFHLSASQPALAKKLSHKAMFWTVVQALILTSILLMFGRYFIVALTVDYTLQHLLDSLLGLVGLANLSMAFSQVCWSLVGAQGRFNLATLVMLVCRWLVTMPLALIFIFGMNFDLYTVAGALAVGSAASACVLVVVLFSSNWHEVAQELFIQGLLSCDEDDDFEFSFGDAEESDDNDDDDKDDEDSFGAEGSGYPSNKKSLDNDEKYELPESTEPTSRTGTNTGSGVNSGADSSGLISGGTISGISGQ